MLWFPVMNAELPSLLMPVWKVQTSQLTRVLAISPLLAVLLNYARPRLGAWWLITVCAQTKPIHLFGQDLSYARCIPDVLFR